MATGGGPTREEVWTRLSCNMCLEPFGKSRCPKLLPCFHTFCLSCLNALEASAVEMKKKLTADPDSEGDSGDVTNAGGGAIGGNDDDTEKAVFLCPTCRAPVPIPEGGVALLQTNVYVNFDATEEELSPASMICDMCENGNQQYANYLCQECSLRMCPTCWRHHRSLSGHHVIPMNPGQAAKAASERKAFCWVHRDQALRFHCGQCDARICLHCKVTSHEGHRSVDVASVEAEYRTQVASLLQVARQQLQLLESSLRRVQRDGRDLTRHALDLTHRFKTRRDVIIASVTQSRDQLFEDLREIEQRRRSLLHAEKCSTSVLADSLSGLISRSARADGNEVVHLKKELQAALLREDLLEQYRQQTARQGAWSRWTYDVCTTSVSPGPVAVSMGWVAVIEAGARDLGKTLSRTELTDKVHRLENDIARTKDDLAQTKDDLTETRACVAQTEDDLKQAKDELEQTQAAVAQSKDDWAQTKAVLTQTKTVVTQTMGVITGTKSDVEEIRADLRKQSDKIAKASTMVAFHASKIDKTLTKRDQPIVFRHVKENEGSGWNETTSMFTAPAQGTYIFSVSLGKTSGQAGYVAAYLLVDDVRYAYLCGSATSTGSSSVSVRLKVGQRVWVKAHSGVDEYTSCGDMCFTGALVQPQL